MASLLIISGIKKAVYLFIYFLAFKEINKLPYIFEYLKCNYMFWYIFYELIIPVTSLNATM